MEHKYALHGIFTFEVHRVDADGNEIPGSRRPVGAESPNLITDYGLNYIGESHINYDHFDYCQLGTGTTAPAITDTALVNKVAHAAGSTAQYTAAGDLSYTSVRSTYTFAQGAYVGNVSEIGVGPNTTGNLFSRALILDESGVPTTLTLTSLDILTVYYETRVYRSLSDTSGTLTIAGVDHSYTIRPARHTAAFAAQFFQHGINFMHLRAVDATTLGATNSNPAGTMQSTGSGPTLAGYTPGTFYRDATWNVSIGQLNFASGLRAMYNGSTDDGISSQWVFSPAVPKDNTKTFSLTIRVSWARYTP